MAAPGGMMDAILFWAVIGLGFGVAAALIICQLGSTYDQTTNECLFTQPLLRQDSRNYTVEDAARACGVHRNPDSN